MTTKVFDTFTGTNGVDLAAHTPDTDVVGTGWVDTSTNDLELDGGGGVKWAANGDQSWIDVGTADQWSEVNYNAGGADNRISINLRRDSNSYATRNHYNFNFRTGDAGGQIKISKVVNGSETTIVSGAFSITNTITYALQPEVSSSNLDFVIDGNSELSTTDTSITTGSFAGIWGNLRSSAAGRFYDFQIDDVAPSGDVTGSGSHQAEISLSTGTAERSIIGSGVSQSLTALSSGIAEREISGSGAAQASTTTSVGTAERIIPGSGSNQSNTATSVGTVERVIVGSGVHQSETATSSGSGVAGGISIGSGVHQAKAAISSGAGERSIVGSGNNQSTYATSTGVALRVITGSGSHQADATISAGNDIILSDIDKSIIFLVSVTKEYNRIIHVTRKCDHDVQITKELLREVRI